MQKPIVHQFLAVSVMAGGVNHRHRIGVLPGLPGSAGSVNVVTAGARNSLLDATSNNERQLVPLDTKALWTGSNGELR